jgi:hypothetical protein
MVSVDLSPARLGLGGSDVRMSKGRLLVCVRQRAWARVSIAVGRARVSITVGGDYGFYDCCVCPRGLSNGAGGGFSITDSISKW